jgi:hypothetical protein
MPLEPTNGAGGEPPGAAPDVIELRTPVGREWDAVSRLVLAGIAGRLELSVEELDDLQLAVERLLLEAGPADEEVHLLFEVDRGEGVRLRIGPLRERHAAAALHERDSSSGRIGLRRILDTVVDSVSVEDGPDGGVVVRLEKLRHGAGHGP